MYRKVSSIQEGCIVPEDLYTMAHLAFNESCFIFRPFSFLP